MMFDWSPRPVLRKPSLKAQGHSPLLSQARSQGLGSPGLWWSSMPRSCHSPMKILRSMVFLGMWLLGTSRIWSFEVCAWPLIEKSLICFLLCVCVAWIRLVPSRLLKPTLRTIKSLHMDRGSMVGVPGLSRLAFEAGGRVAQCFMSDQGEAEKTRPGAHAFATSSVIKKGGAGRKKQMTFNRFY